ncbi:MAG TPA: hypothetical protein VF163_13925, partial [Micromonosporaceae bacterium]
MTSGQITRRTLLRGAAGLSVAAATGLLAGCDSDHPAFLDIASDAVRRDGSILRLKFGPNRGSPGILTVGSTSQQDVNVTVTIESLSRRVVLGADNRMGDDAFTYTTTLSHDQPIVIWARALTTGEPGQPADRLRLRTSRGDIEIRAWVEPTVGGWRQLPDGAAIDLRIVAVHAALMRIGTESEILAFSPPRVRDANDVPQADHHGHELWDLAALHDVEIRAINPRTFASVARPQSLSETVNLFCVGQAHLPQGHLLTAGGHISANSIGDASAHYLHIYDPSSATWRRSSARLRHHRWYPSVTALPDGRMLIASGSSQALVGS